MKKAWPFFFSWKVVCFMVDSPRTSSTPNDRSVYTPAERKCYAVWEITLKCNLACSHCGSRAGDARTDELTTEEALDLVHQLADVGVNEVTLIGGEAYLRSDWLQIAEEITKCGMTATMTTGGYGISETTARRMKEAGIAQVSISIDGLEDVHDRLRGKPGSWAACFRTMEHFRNVGVSFGCNTQINRLSAHQLPLLYEKIRDAGAVGWQVQLTVPMGNAADNSEMLMQPYELMDLYPMLAYLMERGLREGILMQPGNNIGYFGPYERLLRGRGSGDPWSIWTGCQAGMSVLGLEADGAIKGCPSLPTKPYTGANIRDMPLREIIETKDELRFNETMGTERATEHMWGFCKSCEFAELCRGGCSWTAHVFFNKRGNNPYCHHRALVHAAQGLRERHTIHELAPGIPFDNGTFDIVTESCDTPLSPEEYAACFHAGKIQWPESWLLEEPNLPRLVEEANRTIVAAYKGE